MSEAVLADAQFSVARVHRPFAGFEAVYAGVPVSTPIAIPGALDENAGKSGYDPNLLAGIPTSYGSKLTLWLPTIFNQSSEGDLFVVPYRYRFVWRLRNLQDYQQGRLPYHFPSQTEGQSDQFVIPSAINIALYENSPTSEAISGSFTQEIVVQEMEMEAITTSAMVRIPPLTPAGNPGAYQQGLAATGEVGTNTTISFGVYQLDCLGDQLIILIDRLFVDDSASNTWDFSDFDRGFSAFFGTANGTRAPIKNMGVYLLGGANP